MTRNTEPDNAVEVVEQEDVALVALVGAHDLESANRVRDAFSRQLDEHAALVIDLSRTHQIDSIVLGLIITAHERGQHRAKHVVLVTDPHTPPGVLNLLRLSGISRLIDTYPTTAQALQSLARKSRPIIP